MSRIIKNIKKFHIAQLFESAGDELIETFLDDLVAAIYKLTSGESKVHTMPGKHTSYSVVASNHQKNINRNPEEDYKMILSELKNMGWDENDIDKISKNHAEKLAEMHDKNHLHGSLETALGDLVLYKITGGRALLMGYNTVNSVVDVDGDETIFKFYYGYNKTPYGRLAMEQHFGSIDAFLDAVGIAVGNVLSESSSLIYGTEVLFNRLKDKGIESLGDAYSYDPQTKQGILDLGKMGIDYTELKEEIDEALISLGVPLDRDKNISSGYSELEGDKIKMFFV
jgi:hypothetical protein